MTVRSYTEAGSPVLASSCANSEAGFLALVFLRAGFVFPPPLITRVERPFSVESTRCGWVGTASGQRSNRNSPTMHALYALASGIWLLVATRPKYHTRIPPCKISAKNAVCNTRCTRMTAKTSNPFPRFRLYRGTYTCVRSFHPHTPALTRERSTAERVFYTWVARSRSGSSSFTAPE